MSAIATSSVSVNANPTKNPAISVNMMRFPANEARKELMQVRCQSTPHRSSNGYGVTVACAGLP